MIYTDNTRFNKETYHKQFIKEKDIVVVNGRVYDEQGTPVKGALVLLEKCNSNYGVFEMIGYTLTDECGHFTLEIIDKNHQHRITVKGSRLNNQSIYLKGE
jgi:protocatechuate 3,4-dioxygenase beta subunit